MGDNKKRDEFLTEAMGECWHEWDSTLIMDIGTMHACKKCPSAVTVKRPYNNNFSTWKDFGKLWEWAIEQEWWGEFMGNSTDGQSEFDDLIDIDIINPDNLTNAIYKFLTEK